MAQTAGSGGKGSGLAPNIASMLCYICMPISSIVFMLMEKENKDVQFHAWQGTTFGVGWIVFIVVLNILSAILVRIAAFFGLIMTILVPVLGLGVFILWIICVVKAYQGERWKIPYIGDFAEKKAGLA
jgi:uncharacterized membrane protein